MWNKTDGWLALPYISYPRLGELFVLLRALYAAHDGTLGYIHIPPGEAHGAIES
jgi:hypothetical protein